MLIRLSCSDLITSPSDCILTRKRRLGELAGRVGKHDIDAAVLLPPGRRVVRGDGVRLAEPECPILIRRHALQLKSLPHGLRAFARELLVVSGGAGAVGVA